MRSWRWVLVLAALCAPVVAYADGESGHDQGNALHHQGIDLYEKGDFAGALEKFTAAYQIYSSPKILFNIAQAHMKLGHSVEAANAFNRFLSLTLEAPNIAPQRQTARQELDDLAPNLGLLSFSVVPPEAEIRVDKALCAGTSLYVTPGIHEVEVSAPGRQSQTRRVPVRAEENVPVSMVLDSLPSTAAPTPPLVVMAGSPPESTTPVAGWVLAGAGAAALIASGVVGALALSDNNHLRQEVLGGQTDLTNTQVTSLRSSVRTEAWISTAALGVGLVSAAVGIVLILRGGTAEATPTASNGSPAVSFNF